MLEAEAEREFRALLEFLNETPSLVRQLSAGLSADQWKRKPSADEFSFLENVCHLRDIEREGYTVRIRRLLKEDLPRLEDLDGAKLARERNYHAEEPIEALREFESLREKNVEVLGQLEPESLSRSGTFEEVGVVTLKTIASMMREHDTSHREELKGLKAWLAAK